jgi:EAL domain-containing protein (putative c-di-GMP-specific phosphodiesterase class I)
MIPSFLISFYVAYKEIYLGALLIVVLVLSIILTQKYNKLDYAKSRIRLNKKFRKVDLRDYFVLFIEVTNLHIYSQFYDVNINEKIFSKIFDDMVKKFTKNNVFYYRSNQIVITCKHVNKVVVKIRNEEQLAVSKSIIDYISKQHYFLNESDNYYNASLTIGSGSIGLIHQEKDVESLVKLAYFAMIKAKEKGIDILIGNDELRTIKRDLDSFNLEIEKGFILDEFSPFFLPILDPKTMQIVGCESFVRWNKDKYRIVEASKFKEIAIEKNLFEKIDKRVIEKTFQAYLNWSTLHLIDKAFKLSINLSKRTLLDLEINGLLEVLSKYNLKSENVEFDISLDENLTECEIQAIKLIKSKGFKVAFDALSSQHISLLLLGSIDIDTIKLGRFAMLDERDYKLYRTLTKVSKIMNYQVMAKGVETRRDLNISKRLDVDFVQGFYFTKPLNEENFKIFLRKYKDGIII